MNIIVNDLQKYGDNYAHIKGDLIGNLDIPDTSKVDTTKYLYYAVSHSRTDIKETFTDIEKARRFALNFNAKNRANDFPVGNIDNIVGVREEVETDIITIDSLKKTHVQEKIASNVESFQNLFRKIDAFNELERCNGMYIPVNKDGRINFHTPTDSTSMLTYKDRETYFVELEKPGSIFSKLGSTVTQCVISAGYDEEINNGRIQGLSEFMESVEGPLFKGTT